MFEFVPCTKGGGSFNGPRANFLYFILNLTEIFHRIVQQAGLLLEKETYINLNSY